jgi:hypothetical protein
MPKRINVAGATRVTTEDEFTRLFTELANSPIKDAILRVTVVNLCEDDEYCVAYYQDRTGTSFILAKEGE